MIYRSKSDHIKHYEELSQAFGHFLNPKNPHAFSVIKELVRFCRADSTCVVPKSNQMTNVLEGRREVWLYINDLATKTPQELFEKYVQPANQPQKEN